MEVVIKEASKLLGDCKARNIVKDLKKLKEKDIASLEAANKTLQLEVEQLKMALALKEDEVKDFKAQKTEALKEIREIVDHLGDTLNKAKLFDTYINKEVVITMSKVIAILHSFHKKMEAVLGEIRKLVPGLARESSRPLLSPQKKTPQKKKLLEEVKTPLPQRLDKETIEEVSKEVLPAEFLVPKPLAILVVMLETKARKTESPTPSPQKLSLRK